MARVNDGSHNFTCHSHVYSLEWAVLPFIPQPKSITALWPVYTFPVPLRAGGWVGLCDFNYGGPM